MFIDTGKRLINMDNVSMIEMNEGDMDIYLMHGEIVSYTIAKEDMKPDTYSKIVEAISRGDKYLHLGVDIIKNYII